MASGRVRGASAAAGPDWVVLVAVVVLTGVLAAPTFVLGPVHSAGTSFQGAGELVRHGSSSSSVLTSGPSAVTHPVSSSASVGIVTRTVFPGYNTSLPGSFVSSVAAWEAGTPTYVPSTNTLWFPQRDVLVSGDPVPIVAPVAVFNLSSGGFDRLVTNVSNASCLVYNPSNGDIYAAIPTENAVRVIDPRTDAVVASKIPVGTMPSALAVDPAANLLFVANAGSSNVTVVNTLHNAVEIPGITVGAEPLGLAVDPNDNLVFVDNAGDTITNAVSVLNISNLEEPVGTISVYDSPVVGIAYSAPSGSLVVTDPSSSYATILNTSLRTVVTRVDVGTGMSPAATSANGTEFVVANASGGDVDLLNAATGTEVHPSVTVQDNATELAVDSLTSAVYVWASIPRELELLNLSTGMVQSTTPSTFPDLLSESGLPVAAQLYAAASNGSIIYGISAERLVNSASPAVVPASPLSIVSDPSNAELYVGTVNGVYVYDEPTGHFVGTVTSLTGDCSQLQLDAKDNFVWLSNSVQGVVAVNLTSLKLEIPTGINVGVGANEGIAVDDSDSEIFVLTNSSAVTVLRSGTGSVLTSGVKVGTNVTSLAFDSADDQIYAAGDSVTLIDGVTFVSDGSPISLGTGHKVLGEAYEPSRQDIYIASSGLLPGRQGLVSVLDGASVGVAGSSLVQIQVGEEPDALAAVSEGSPASSELSSVWVANAQSGTISVISTPPQITSLSVTPSPLDLGHTTVVTVAYSGGAGTIAASYQGLPAGCLSEDTEDLNCMPSMPGVYDVVVTLTDSLGLEAIGNTTITVLPALTLRTTFSLATFPRVDVGVPLNGTAVASNGLAPYSYGWSMGDGSLLAGSNISHSFDSPGAYAVTVVARDATGATVNSTTVVTVTSRPSINLALNPGNVTDVDFPVTFTTMASGGTGLARETWIFGDGTEASGENVSHAWTQSGVYTVSAEFEDLLGVTANRTVVVTVHPSLSATFHSGNVSTANPATTGTSVAFSATISGGSPPYVLAWFFGDGSMASGLVADHSYGSAGTYTVRAVLTDSVGAVVATNLTIAVSSGPGSGGLITSLGSGFQAGLFLGLLLGGIIAAVVLFVAGPRKGARPPPSPVPPYVPP